MKRSKVLNIIFIAVISIIVITMIVLAIVAISQSKDEILPSSSPESSDSIDNDDFDPNDYISREDKAIMTVDLTTVKFSEFNYFYYIAAEEFVNTLKFPENSSNEEKDAIISDLINNGKDGKTFHELVFESAKREVIKYILIKNDFIKEGYVTSVSHELFLKSNYMYASTPDELDEYDNKLLFESGVTRNEMIDIMVWLQGFTDYRNEKLKNMAFEDEELKAIYDESNTYKYKTIRFIRLGTDDFELAETLKARVESGYDMEKLVDEYSKDITKVQNKGLLSNRYNEFSSEEIRQWVSTAEKNECIILPLSDGVCVIKLENDGSFELRKNEISAEKALLDFQTSYEKRIDDGLVNVIMNDNVVSEITLPLFLEEFKNDFGG